MSFVFEESMVNEYLSRGYLIMRGIVPPALLRDLRVEAEKARALARKLNGPQTQRIQPLSRYGDDLDLRPFHDYNDLPALRDAVTSLLGPDYTHGHIDVMGLLTEPADHPWNIGWHRDGVVEVRPEARDEIVEAKLADAWYDLRHFNGINCAIYAESCTWYVPGSHLRQWDMPGEEQTTGQSWLRKPEGGLSNTEAERLYLAHCREFPGAVQAHLGPGDFMIYRNLAWHTGNYITYQPRATIHDGARYEGDKSWTGWLDTKQDALRRWQEKADAAEQTS